MKKIIALCSFVVALAVVVTMFTACGNKPEDETTTTTTQPTVEIGGITVQIGEKFAIIKDNGSVVQTLKYPEDSNVKFDLEYAKEHYEFIDFNFDGVDDFYIATNADNSIINYYCWIYNETSKFYEFSKELSELKNISVDAENHLIVSKVPDGNSEKISCYKWVDGVLTLDKTYDSAKDEIPEDVTNAVTNNSIGVNKNPEKPNKVETTKKQDNTKNTTEKQNNKETTKKPLNTTTTQPQYQGGVVLNTNADIDDGWN